jgi:hypothetical protein
MARSTEEIRELITQLETITTAPRQTGTVHSAAHAAANVLRWSIGESDNVGDLYVMNVRGVARATEAKRRKKDEAGR